MLKSLRYRKPDYTEPDRSDGQSIESGEIVGDQTTSRDIGDRKKTQQFERFAACEPALPGLCLRQYARHIKQRANAHQRVCISLPLSGA